MPRTKLTEKVITEIAAIIKAGGSRKEASYIAGVDVSAYHKWIRHAKDGAGGLKKQLLQAIEEAEAFDRFEDLDIIKRAAQRGDWRAAQARILHLPAIKEGHEKARLERKRLKLQIEREKIETEVTEVELEHKKILVQKLREAQGTEGASLIAQQLSELQSSPLTEEEKEAIYAAHPIPSSNEDDKAHEEEVAQNPTEEENNSRSDITEEKIPTIPFDPKDEHVEESPNKTTNTGM